MCNLVGFYFIKQKTAYELRISDWSSDVFSSDLADTRLNREKPPTKAMTDHLLSSRASCASSIMSSTAATVSSPATNTKVAILITSGALRSRKGERNAAPIDRKSVVEGKRVSVRLDLGGRRIIKKKINVIDREKGRKQK